MKAELARVDRLAQGSVLMSAVVTTVALQWVVSTAGPLGSGSQPVARVLLRSFGRGRWADAGIHHRELPRAPSGASR